MKAHAIAVLAVVLLAGLALPHAALAQCQGGTVIFTDDMESGPNGWFTYRQVVGDANLCVEDQWGQDNTIAAPAPTSGQWTWTNIPYNEAGGVDGSGQCIDWVQSPTFTVPPNTDTMSLTFWHHFSIETDFDGGVVEVSTTGTSWTAVSPTYTDVSQPGNGTQFNEEVLSLDGTFVPGGDYMIRYQFLSDQLVTQGGWRFDDVTVQACLDPIPTEEATWGNVKAVFGSDTPAR